jgi:hypothetical protein
VSRVATAFLPSADDATRPVRREGNDVGHWRDRAGAVQRVGEVAQGEHAVAPMRVMFPKVGTRGGQQHSPFATLGVATALGGDVARDPVAERAESMHVPNGLGGKRGGRTSSCGPKPPPLASIKQLLYLGSTINGVVVTGANLFAGVAGEDGGVDFPSEVDDDEGEEHRGEAQLGRLPHTKNTDARTMLGDEAVERRQDGQSRSPQHEGVDNVLEHHSNDVASGGALSGQLEPSPAATLPPHWLVADEAALRVEDDAKRWPLREPMAFESVTEAKLVEITASLLDVGGGIELVPPQSVEVIKVRRQDGSSNADRRRRSSCDKKQAQGVGTTESERTLGGNDHDLGAHVVTKVERPAPTHGQHGKASKDRRVSKRRPPLAPRIVVAIEVEIVPAEGGPEGEEFGNQQVEEKVETVNEIDSHHQTTIWPRRGSLSFGSA